MLVFLFTGGFVLIYLENIWQQYLQGIKVGWYFYVQVGLYLLYLQYLENIWQQYLQEIKVGWYFYVQVGLY